MIWTFTVHAGITLVDASVTVHGSRIDVDAALAAGGGSIVTTDPDYAAALKELRAEGIALLDVNGVPDSSVPPSPVVNLRGRAQDFADGQVAEYDAPTQLMIPSTVAARLGVVESSIAALRARTMTALGDSLSAVSGGIPDSRHPVAQAVLASGGRLIYAAPYATSGKRSDEVIALHLASAVASSAGIVQVLAGTNDIAQGVVNSVIAANLLTMWRAILAVGKTPVACSLPPNNGWTNAQRKQLRQLNLWIGMQANALGIPFANYFAGLVDPSTGLYTSGLLFADGLNTHWNGNGGAIVGPILADAVDPFVPGGTVPLISYGDSAGGTASGNRTDNPLMLRSTVSPPLPDGVGVSTAGAPASTYSTPAALSPGVGNILRVVTGNLATASLLRFFLGSNAVTPGEVYLFGFRLAWTPATHALAKLTLLDSDTGVTDLGGFKLWDVAIPWGSVWWEAITIPGGTVNVEPRLAFSNDGTAAAPSTFDIGQTTLHNLADIPVIA